MVKYVYFDKVVPVAIDIVIEEGKLKFSYLNLVLIYFIYD